MIRIFLFLISMNFTTLVYSAEAVITNIDDDLISLNFNQTKSTIILQSLADFHQMNLIVDEIIDTTQTVKLNSVDWHKALQIITKNANLQYGIEGNLLIIHQFDEQKLKKENALQQSLILRSYPINYADIKSIITLINDQNILSAQGKIIADENTNTLVVNEIESNIPKLSAIIKELDKSIPQIQVSAHIVTMSNESVSELGVKWGYLGSSSQLVDHFNLNFGATSSMASVGFNLAKRSSNLLNLELSALEAENKLSIIASPNLVTSNQHIASIKQGTDIPYEVSNGKNGSTSIEFKQAVLGLEVTPKILTNGKMQLTLYITQNTAGRSIKRSDGGEALAIDTQEIKTQVFVNSGETLVLGGIFQQSNFNDMQSIPGINKVPILGGLFKYKNRKQQKRELVIFITPQLIKS